MWYLKSKKTQKFVNKNNRFVTKKEDQNPQEYLICFVSHNAAKEFACSHRDSKNILVVNGVITESQKKWESFMTISGHGDRNGLLYLRAEG